MELCFILKEKKIVIFDTETVEEKDVRILSSGVVLNPAVRIGLVFSYAHTKFFRHSYSSAEVQGSPFHVHLIAGLRL